MRWVHCFSHCHPQCDYKVACFLVCFLIRIQILTPWRLLVLLCLNIAATSVTNEHERFASRLDLPVRLFNLIPTEGTVYVKSDERPELWKAPSVVVETKTRDGCFKRDVSQALCLTCHKVLRSSSNMTSRPRTKHATQHKHSGKEKKDPWNYAMHPLPSQKKSVWKLLVHFLNSTSVLIDVSLLFPGFGPACGAHPLLQSPWRRWPLLHWHHTRHCGIPGLLCACRVCVPYWQAKRDPCNWARLKKKKSEMSKSSISLQSEWQLQLYLII